MLLDKQIFLTRFFKKQICFHIDLFIGLMKFYRKAFNSYRDAELQFYLFIHYSSIFNGALIAIAIQFYHGIKGLKDFLRFKRFF